MYSIWPACHQPLSTSHRTLRQCRELKNTSHRAVQAYTMATECYSNAAANANKCLVATQEERKLIYNAQLSCTESTMQGHFSCAVPQHPRVDEARVELTIMTYPGTFRGAGVIADVLQSSSS